MTDERKKEFALRISQANATGLIVILYEMILVYLEESIDFFEKGNKEGFLAGIRKSRNCIGELMQSLDRSYEVAEKLYSLYVFFLKELVRAEQKNTKQPLETLVPMIESLRDAYKEVSKQNTAAPLMENAQTIYAGYTYGKNDVNVSLVDAGSNRGFTV